MKAAPKINREEVIYLITTQLRCLGRLTVVVVATFVFQDLIFVPTFIFLLFCFTWGMGIEWMENSGRDSSSPLYFTAAADY